jgi:hypothetical protein
VPSSPRAGQKRWQSETRRNEFLQPPASSVRLAPASSLWHCAGSRRTSLDGRPLVGLPALVVRSVDDLLQDIESATAYCAGIRMVPRLHCGCELDGADSHWVYDGPLCPVCTQDSYERYELPPRDLRLSSVEGAGACLIGVIPAAAPSKD